MLINNHVDISRFTAHLSQAGGLARLNRFEVIIPTRNLQTQSATIAAAVQAQDEFPDMDGTDWFAYNVPDYDAVYRLTAFCQKSTLPGYQYQADSQRIYGPSWKVPHAPEWADVTMEFLMGTDMNEKYFFEAWQYMVMDPISNNFNYLKDYAADVCIVSIDDFDTPQYATWLINAWPISISPIDLSMDNNDSVMRLQVTFTYKYASWFSGSQRNQGIRGPKETFGQTITPA